jgi:hypothetical protein
MKEIGELKGNLPHMKIGGYSIFIQNNESSIIRGGFENGKSSLWYDDVA